MIQKVRMVQKERNSWLGKKIDYKPGEVASTCQQPGRHRSESYTQDPILTTGSDWSFKGRVIRQWSSLALINSASLVDSSFWSIHRKKEH